MDAAVRPFGRDAELAAVTSFLERLPNGPAALLLAGQAGIGKTTIWLEALRAARARGYTVLACAPGELETKLAYSALGDLLEEVADEAVRTLASPQRRALEHAILRTEADEPADQRAVSVAFLAALRSLARRAPLLVGIDDVHWLDTSSSRVLQFAFRRLKNERIGVAVAQRRDEPTAVPPSVRALPVQEVEIGPLSREALEALFRHAFGTTLARPLTRQLEETSRGNPFFALELAAAVLRHRESLRPRQALPVSDALRALLGERLALLPPGVRDALLVVAAASHPTLAQVEAALRTEDARLQVTDALERGLLEVERGRLRLTHPLVGSVVYADASARQRQDVHRRLAESARELEERAGHLALATTLPEEDVAVLLDAAASRAAQRGAPDAAAGFSEEAVRLTPPEHADSIVARTLAAAEHHFAAGETDRSRQLLQRLARGLSPDPTRARVLRHLARVEAYGQGWRQAEELLERARNEARGDDALAASVGRDLGVMAMQHGELGKARDHLRRSLELGRASGDATLAADTKIDLATVEFQMGLGDPERVREVLAPLRYASGDAAGVLPRRLHFVMWAKYSDRFAQARTAIVDLIAHLRDRHEEGLLGPALFHAGELECWSGNLDAAAEYALELRETAARNGQPVLLTRSLYLDAIVDAYAGRVESSRRASAEGLSISEEVGDLMLTTRHLATRGFLDLSLGEPASAHESLERAREISSLAGYGEPGMFRFAGDAIEVLVGLGELGRAAERLEELERQARRLDRAWALAAAGRCRCLVAAAQHDHDGSVAAGEDALLAHERLETPLELGRTLLTLGVAHRRAKRKQRARQSLTEALAIFEKIPAPLWASRARAELGRIGGRAPAPEGLTPTEQHVASLVANGHTNREVAATLFISAKTVEKHLTRIYEKVGVRTRRQLARRLGAAQ